MDEGVDNALDEARDRLVQAVLVHVPFDGWSWESLKAAALDLGYDETMPERAFPGGPVEAVAHFSGLADRKMSAAIAGRDDWERTRLDRRIAFLLRRRIEDWADHRETIRRALALLALPGNAALGARLAWKTADEVWYGAGDRSSDFSYYTKRAIVVGILSATTLYWLADKSDDYADSWAFLDRRIADSLKITRLRRQAVQCFRKGPRFGGLGAKKGRFGIRTRS